MRGGLGALQTRGEKSVEGFDEVSSKHSRRSNQRARTIDGRGERCQEREGESHEELAEGRHRAQQQAMGDVKLRRVLRVDISKIIGGIFSSTWIRRA